MTNSETNILHYKIAGKGPVIVLLHGFLCSGRYWDNIRTQLEAHHTVVTIDLLGFGESPRPKKSTYDYDEHLAWIKRTLGHAKITEPVLLAGHSMGSLLALRYSVQYPDKTSRLVLVNPPLFESREQARKELAGTNFFFRAALYWHMHHLMVPIMRTKGMKALARRVTEPRFKGMEQYIFSSSGIARDRSLHNVIENQQAIDDLGKLTIPTTIISGRKERKMYRHNIAKLTRRSDTYVVFADTGHHTPIEDPELLLKILQQK